MVAMESIGNYWKFNSLAINILKARHEEMAGLIEIQIFSLRLIVFRTAPFHN